MLAYKLYATKFQLFLVYAYVLSSSSSDFKVHQFWYSPDIAHMFVLG